jgi:hypothetical protein
VKWRLAVNPKLAKIILVAACFSLLTINLVEEAAAQEAKTETAAKTEKPATAEKSGGGKKKTDIDFEDELVEGEVKKPELFYLLQKKQFNFKRLIKLREDFLPEMRRDGYTIRRGKSK